MTEILKVTLGSLTVHFGFANRKFWRELYDSSGAVIEFSGVVWASSDRSERVPDNICLGFCT